MGGEGDELEGRYRQVWDTSDELLTKEALEASKTIQALAIPLGYLPELVGDKTLLKITQEYFIIARWAEIKLQLSWKCPSAGQLS